MQTAVRKDINKPLPEPKRRERELQRLAKEATQAALFETESAAGVGTTVTQGEGLAAAQGAEMGTASQVGALPWGDAVGNQVGPTITNGGGTPTPPRTLLRVIEAAGWQVSPDCSRLIRCIDETLNETLTSDASLYDNVLDGVEARLSTESID